MDLALKGITSYDKSIYKNIDVALLNTLFTSRKLLNSSCSIKDIDDFYQSIQIYILRMYYKNSFIDKCLGIKKKLSHSKIANNINIILEHMFGMSNSNLTYTRFNQKVQLKTHFDDLEIYEFRTKRNFKKHPFLD